MMKKASGFRKKRRLNITVPLQNQSKIPRQNGDRYIADRSSVDLSVARYLASGKVIENNNIGNTSDKLSKEGYKREIAATLFKSSHKSRILKFSRKPNATQSILSEAASPHPRTKIRKLVARHVPQTAERTFDAPNLIDDFYLNLLDWSSNNIICIALGNTVFLWDVRRDTISELLTVCDDFGPITSINWAPDGKHIAVGLTNSDVQLWDCILNRQLRSFQGHRDRVASLAWNSNILTTGDESGSILNHDSRIHESIVQTYIGHTDEVCGLKWSQSGKNLASGGDDKLLHIWDINMSSSTQYLHRLDEHCAAVKALAWCPYQSNTLASGGGSTDRCIKLWNTVRGACLNTIDTNSQVCALLWNKHEHELLSSHGNNQNQLTLWKYPSMVKITDLTGHTSRVLHLAQSPDGYTVASAAADETLKLWQVFGTPDTSKTKRRKEPRGAFNKYLIHIH